MQEMRNYYEQGYSVLGESSQSDDELEEDYIGDNINVENLDDDLQLDDIDIRLLEPSHL